ncbi:MAG: SGNH/GDSL hydrolase family protein [Nanoarchaeota archaeon]|nr:SGNH/GDSL hydrolase family protein [Nanoarchaeota archaeon]MBU4300945.1 SGNH/GDSL hydrolase family protein [Nanoarchaeota archaeon]MBU4452259.1 SGNH/GDSL hydrolase family protein [Nanoarchaeota archaeon]MCG2724529.1 SGNH/GDSL hydrolase family protein [archaeon]
MMIKTQPKILYFSDADSVDFEEKREAIDVICVGDSITGWNNIRMEKLRTYSGPFPTYPQFLQEKLSEILGVADYGISGALSRDELVYVKDALTRFPNAQYVVLGFGTNDMGQESDLESTSEEIINNYNKVIQVISERAKPILINVPYLNESMTPREFIAESKKRRDYHNQRLKRYCDSKNIYLVDICSVLNDDCFSDAVHPNEKGARLIANELYKLLVEKVMRRPVM